MIKKQPKGSVLLMAEDKLDELIYSKIREILPSDIRDVKLSKELKLEDLGVDSIQYVNLLFSLEDIILLDLEEIAEKVDIASIRTVGDIINIVKSFQ